MVLKPLKKKVSITLDEELIEKVKAYAEETDRSFSQYINILLKKHIEAKENKQKSLDLEWFIPTRSILLFLNCFFEA